MDKVALTGSFRAESLNVEVYDSAEAMGLAAATATAERLVALAAQNELVSVIFATGASQLAILQALTAMRDLPWGKVIGFHMDEYLGIPSQHPASFRRYLRERLTDKVKMRQFHEVNGSTSNAGTTCQEYAEWLRRYPPQLCLLGIGENGHIAFNDPSEADFEDPLDVKIVSLDERCRQQQVNEGWFGSLAEVPHKALTLTIPALTRVPQLIASVPGGRKAHIVYRTLTEQISTRCPATILRTHPDATVYLDPDSAAELSR